jgi:hypothetical protein
MFIKIGHDIKKSVLINVDVATKLITAVAMKNKSKEECTAALLQVKAECLLYGHAMSMVIFDREMGMTNTKEKMKAEGVQMRFTAMGQKVGLAEVNIRII